LPYDGAVIRPKKIVGRKRSVATDTLGLLLAVIVIAASVTENKAGIQVLDQVKATYPTITKTWVDAGFKNQFVEHAAEIGVDAEVVPRKQRGQRLPCGQAAVGGREDARLDHAPPPLGP
jgi:hypothetical protein